MERGSLYPAAFVGLMFVSALNIGVAIGESSADAPQRVKEAQLHNEQLEDQLDASYPRVVHLLLEDEDMTFSFETRGENGEALTCEGAYEVEEETAAAVGDLACTQTTPLGG